MRASASSLPPPSPLATAEDSADVASPAEDPLAGVPELTSYQATTEDDKVDALKLVADSVAQLRQKANSTLMRHPVNLAVLIGVTSIFARYLSILGKDWIAVGMALSGALMIYFAAARLLTQPYIDRAEQLNWAWLGSADIFVTKFGEEIIGALIIEWVSGESRTKRKKAWRGEVKGWAVRMKYRGKGVGTALLEDAVREAKSKGAESVDFANDHAGESEMSWDILRADKLQLQSRLCQASTTNHLRLEREGRVSCCKMCSTTRQPGSASRVCTHAGLNPNGVVYFVGIQRYLIM